MSPALVHTLQLHKSMYHPTTGDKLEMVFDEDSQSVEATVDEIIREGTLARVRFVDEDGGEQFAFVVFSADGSYTWVATVVEEEKEPWQQ